MNAAEQLAAQRAKMLRRRNTVSVTVDVGEVDVTVDLAEIDTDELVSELEQRGAPEAARVGALAASGLTEDEAERMFQLFRTGRREEAANLCERWLADVLGKVM